MCIRDRYRWYFQQKLSVSVSVKIFESIINKPGFWVYQLVLWQLHAVNKHTGCTVLPSSESMRKAVHSQSRRSSPPSGSPASTTSSTSLPLTNDLCSSRCRSDLTALTEPLFFLRWFLHYSNTWPVHTHNTWSNVPWQYYYKSLHNHCSSSGGSFTNPTHGLYTHDTAPWQYNLSLIHIWRCRRSYACRSRWSPYH